jgi:hypothetical protein
MSEAIARVREITRQHEAPVEFVRLGRDVELAEWRDPTDDNPNARTPKTVKAYRRVDVLATLYKRGGLVTLEHRAGAERYRTAYEVGHEGAVGGGSGGRGERVQECYQPGGPTMARLDQLSVYRAATQAVGPTLSGVLMHVVLLNSDVTGWAEWRGVRREVAMGFLIAALDRLCEHFGVFSLDEIRAIKE